MVLCFGELLLRLSTQPDWVSEKKMSAYIGGAELNVARTLNLWGVGTKYFTAIPQNYITSDIISHYAGQGINFDHVLYKDGRLGTFYLAQGLDMKHDGLVYDRADSVITKVSRKEINWAKIFDGVTWFHFSAITPAISDKLSIICEDACAYAASKNITISIDLNYRSRLWKYGKLPAEIMPRLLKYCNVVMGNLWALETYTGIPVNTIKIDEKDYEQAGDESTKTFFEMYKNCQTMAFTFRFDNEEAEGINYTGYIATRTKTHLSKKIATHQVMDKVGSGDCFMAALIYGLKDKVEIDKIVDLCAKAAVSKMDIIGDATTLTIGDILNRKYKFI
jgi:2-dehydro-3-deoxygluconokinase